MMAILSFSIGAIIYIQPRKSRLFKLVLQVGKNIFIS